MVSLSSIEDWSLPETTFSNARASRAYWVFALSSQSAGLSGRDYGGQDWSTRTRESAALLKGCYWRYIKRPTAVTATRSGLDDIKVVVGFACCKSDLDRRASTGFLICDYTRFSVGRIWASLQKSSVTCLCVVTIGRCHHPELSLRSGFLERPQLSAELPLAPKSL